MNKKAMFDLLEKSLKKIHNTNIKITTPDDSVRKFKPFFTSLSSFISEKRELEVKNGSTFYSGCDGLQRYQSRLEVRVGNNEKGGATSSGIFSLPLSLDQNSSWSEIWLTANEVLWEAVKEYEDKIINGMGLPSRERKELFDYFSKEQPITFEGPFVRLRKVQLEDILRRVTRDLARPDILDIDASVTTTRSGQFYVNSEGSHIFTSEAGYSMYLCVSTADENGFVIPHEYYILTKNPKNLPNYNQLMEIGEQLVSEVLEIRNAPFQENGAFPAILCPKNHGVIWHEVIGHSLEGHRMQEDEDGDVSFVFRDHMGKKIAPEFLSLYDDPTDKNMWGHYLFDEEGIPSQRVTLVENGILKSYLHSRESAGYFKTNSNGHARADGNDDPVARMSNLIVNSSNSVPYEELKDNLMKMCRDSNTDYGLLLKDCAGGLTLPEGSYYETVPVNIFRIFTDGREERVRGIYVVGTPHQTLQNIVQTSDRFGSFIGFCGAESGSVNTEEKAPDALVRCLEINRLPKSSYYRLPKIILHRDS